MNREDIEQWTREAGGFDATPEFLAKFAALVASAEREECANLCKEMYLSGDMDTGLAEEAIRARGQA
jgi:hypothetical protein